MSGPTKVFLSLALISTSLSISPTFAFTKGQFCASLHNAANSGGQAFSLTEGSSFSNLEDEFVTLDAPWNATASFTVEPGCTLRACNESYYSGDCRDFKQNLTELPVSSFTDILSASCSCPRACKCDDVTKIRRNSCGRAYLFEGGCNNCVPYYMDLKEGESESFPQDAETEVTAIMVRPGCKLNMYEEPNMEGDSQTVEQMLEKWTSPVRSYECSCEPGSEDHVTPPPPTPRPENYPPLIDIPPTLDEIVSMMNGGLSKHPGLLAALKSNRGKRSSKNAYILLLGSTGAGKSSAINMLFDNPNITRVGGSRSVTKGIHEFRIPIPVHELGIQNSELRVIDTPGLGDTEGLESDARFLATLEEYLDGHEELKDRIPNVVLIFHKFTDNRFEGQGSQYVKMIRGLDSFRNKLTDKRFSNVIFVFSHFTSVTQKVRRNPKAKLKTLKTVIEEYSKFPRPVVLAVAENKAAEEGLLMLNGYYKLPNGEYYPKNLFDRITQVTRGGGDAIGDAVIRSAFRNMDTSNITQIDFSLGEHQTGKIPKYLGVLTAAAFAVEKTEVSDKLAVAHDSMDLELKQRFPDALVYLQKSLNLEGYMTASDLPKTTIAIVKLISGLRQNDAVLFLLKKAFDISPPVLKEEVLTGHSYNVFKDHPLPVSPFDLGELQNSDIGYTFPAMITCNVDFQNKDVLHFLKNRNEYLDERIRSLNIAGRIPLESFTGAIKPGHNVFDVIASPDGNLTSPVTAVREIRLFELVLNDRFKLTDEFTKAVRSLSPCNESDHASVDQWKSFFNEYGTHVVKSAYGGGAIEIEVRANKLNAELQGALMSFIQFAEDISFGKVSNSSLNFEGVKHSLKFAGGDKNHHTSDLSKLSLQEASDLLEKWKESLIYSPTILRSEMRLLPISQVTKRLGQNISSEIEKATRLLFNSSLIYNPPPAASKNLPGEDRGATQIAQTNELVSMFMEKMMAEARKSDERHEKLFLMMQEERKIDQQQQRERMEIQRAMQAELMREQIRNAQEIKEWQQNATKERHEEDKKNRIITGAGDMNSRTAASELQTLQNAASILPSIISSIYASSIGNFRQTVLFVFEIRPRSLQAVGYDALLSALERTGHTAGHTSEILSFAVLLQRSISETGDTALKDVQAKLPTYSVRKLTEGGQAKLKSMKSTCLLIGDKHKRVYNYKTTFYEGHKDYLSGYWVFESALKDGNLREDWRWWSFKIKNVLQGKYLEANQQDGKYAYLRDSSTDPAQLWQIFVVDKDYIRIMNRETKLFITDENDKDDCNKWTPVKPRMAEDSEVTWKVD